MLSKSPLIQKTAFHTSSSWQKMFYNELKSVILKRYWIASLGKIERPQRNEVHKEWPFQPWTTCSWDNDHTPEMQSGSLGRRNIHLDHSLIQECGILSNRLKQKRRVWPVAKHWWHKMHVRGKSDLQIHWTQCNARDNTSCLLLPQGCAFWLQRCFTEMLTPG